MAKKKKTRQQKIIAELRHRIFVQQGTPLISEKPQAPPLETPRIVVTPKSTNVQTVDLSFTQTQSYGAKTISKDYFVRDIKKTAVLTSAVVAAEVVLFLLLKNHILQLPIVRF